MAHLVLDELWAVAQQEAEKHGTKQEYAFGEIGLFLEIPITNWGYYPTPINTSTFASTHGDSVHYGLFHVDGTVTDESPVVMTVPCNSEQHNFILGESLTEFLCLGCEVGYFSLEQLAYGWQNMVDYLSRADHPNREENDEDDQNSLNVLIQAFALKPWQQVGERLSQLHDEYHELLVLPPDE